MEKKNILFGLRPIIEAIEAGREFEKIYLKKGADGVPSNMSMCMKCSPKSPKERHHCWSFSTG